MKTRIYQDHYKVWIAESTIMISKEKSLELSIRTSKSGRSDLITRASVSVFKDKGGWISKEHKLFQDFSKEYLVTRPGRITQKAVEKQHTEIDFDEIIKDAKEFYGV